MTNQTGRISRPRHRLSDFDDASQTASCSACQARVALFLKSQGSGKPRKPICWNAYLADKTRTATNRSVGMVQRLAAMSCECCGFGARDACQLSVDRVIPAAEGGDAEEVNLWVICANCQRYKQRWETGRAGRQERIRAWQEHQLGMQLAPPEWRESPERSRERREAYWLRFEADDWQRAEYGLGPRFEAEAADRADLLARIEAIKAAVMPEPW